MHMITRDYLETHYSNILLPNKNAILSGGVIDGNLINAAADNRWSLVLLLRISPDISDRIEETIEELKVIEPNQYYYPKQDFHITVMDILKGELNRSIPENIDSYRKCIEDCVSKISPFSIEFDGLTASNGAVMVKGFYDEELQCFREQLRKSFRESNLELQERYETISSHITIARFMNKLENPKELLSYVEKEHYFGKMKVDSIEFAFHNWYDTRKKVLGEFTLS